MLDNIQQFILLRLNYDWRYLVDSIRAIDSSHLEEGDKIWQDVYTVIIQKLNGYLGSRKVDISSEYMIFDNCIRQLNDVHLLEEYYTIVSNFKQILGLTVFLPMEYIREQIYLYDERDWFDIKLEEVNRLVFKRDFKNNDKTYNCYELNVDGLLTMDDLMVGYPDERELLQEVVVYIESLYIQKIWMPRLEETSQKRVIFGNLTEGCDANVSNISDFFSTPGSKGPLPQTLCECADCTRPKYRYGIKEESFPRCSVQ